MLKQNLEKVVKKAFKKVSTKTMMNMSRKSFCNFVSSRIPEEIKRDYQLFDGATKGVLVHRTDTTVPAIKFSFSKGFGYRRLKKSPTRNYCSIENRISKKSKKVPFIAKTSFLTRYRGVDFYTQERCISAEEVDIQRNRNYWLLRENPMLKAKMEYVKKKCDEVELYDFDGSEKTDFWLVDFYEAYGEDGLKALADFIDKWSINDLHENNIGYAMSDGRPVLFDYSGYNGFCSSFDSRDFFS